MVVLGSALRAQSGKTITIRFVDGKTGEAVTPSNIQVSLDRKQSSHSEWVRQNDDGTADVRVPASTTEISVHATYDNSTEYYINCDSAKQKDTSARHWYMVSDILTAGIVTPNGCGKPKDAEKLKVDPRPGEFVLFVRKHNWREPD
jgi:hypothetical protein